MRTQRLIGVISDTHGLVRPEALRVLARSHLIVHAGDIGKPEVISSLRSIAPVIAIRGNNDKGRWARNLPETRVLKLGQVRIYILHNLKELRLDPTRERFHVVIAGHSHRPSIARQNGVLYLNPGSAGPRRFKLPVAVARLTVKGTAVEARILELDA